MPSVKNIETAGQFHRSLSFIEKTTEQSSLSPTQIEKAVAVLVDFKGETPAELEVYLNRSARELLTTEGNEAYKITQFAQQLYTQLENYSTTTSKLRTFIRKMKDGSAYKHAITDEDLQHLVPHLEQLTAESELALTQNRQFFESVILRAKQTALVKIAAIILPAHAVATSGEMAAGKDGVNPGLFAITAAVALARVTLELQLIKRQRPTSTVELVAINHALSNRDKAGVETWVDQVLAHEKAAQYLNLTVRTLEIAPMFIAALVIDSPEWAQAALSLTAVSNGIGFTGDIAANIKRKSVATDDETLADQNKLETAIDPEEEPHSATEPTPQVFVYN